MKKAILVVSFGTTYLDTLQLNIAAIEDKIRTHFPDFEVRRAFTSRMVIKRLADRAGLHVDTEEQALEKLLAEGYTEVYVQPLHVVAGEEYEKIRRLVVRYAHNKTFAKIRIGRPLLYYMGQEDQPDDYLTVLAAVAKQLPPAGEADALVFMGHGGTHPANAAYAVLQLKFAEAGLERTFVYTVEGFPALESVIEKLKEHKIRNVRLAPFMLVAGDHAKNDMAGEDDESAKSRLAQAGFKVDALLKGLGENELIQDIYLQHLRDAISGKHCHKH